MTDRTVEVGSLVRTLERYEWRAVGGMPGLYEVWSHPEGRDEVIVPLAAERADFEHLMDRALANVRLSLGDEGVKVLEGFKLSLAGSLDISRWQKESSLPGGAISWAVGERHYQAVRESLVAAAKAARKVRRVHGSGSAFVARSFLDSVLMGQTQIGSFVVTAHIPSAADIAATRSVAERPQERHGADDFVSTDRIVDRLEGILSVARAGLEEYRLTPRIEVFDKAVDQGFSYESARALENLARDGDCAVTVERGANLLEPAGRSSEFVFEAPDAVVFEKVARRFVQRHAPAESQVIGEVTLLSRDHERDALVRVIRLESVVAPVRKVRVVLTPEQYELALAAHAQERPLRVRGLVERESNLHWIYNPTEVSIADAPRVSSRSFVAGDEETLFDL